MASLVGFLAKKFGSISMGFQQFFEELPTFHPLTVFTFLVFLIFLYKFMLPINPITRGNPLPSPPKLPILGNLHQLGKLPHRSLRSLSRQYGELMLLHIGTKPSLVVSSADTAKEIMKTHDAVFANRPKLRIASKLSYNCTDIVFSPYGDYWRQIKSICVLQLLSNKKVRSFQAIREEETALLVEKLKKSASPNSAVVNLSEFIETLTNDVICRAAFGKTYSGKDEGTNFKGLVKDFTELLGVFSMGDLAPWLTWIDKVNGLDSRVEKVAKDFDTFLETVVRDHHNTNKYNDDEVDKGENVKNLVDVLLQIQMENKEALSTDSIKALILDMFAGGTDTIYTVLEWAMAELLRRPEAMKNLQEEVREIIVRGKGRVTEDDLDKMKYLKAVIKETLRLHPPIPLLVFREPSQDVKINGYDIAAKTQVIINAWAIQRDPAYWEQPEEFRPERFLNSSLDFKGQDFQYIPFGSGRRGCPGISFGMVSVELVLATLVHEFDWKIPTEAEYKTLDMTEGAGIIVHKRDPLMLIATSHSCQ